MTTTRIRTPAAAGMFYPEEPHSLERELEQLLAKVAAKKPKGRILALVSPHAGYQYSGFTAASAFRLVSGAAVDTVVIVSPSHREYFAGISVFEGAAYRTPLGDLEIDAPLRAALVEGDTCIESSSLGHGQEHAVEVQLPFIQKVLGGVKILPIVMGDQKRSFCFHLGGKLASVLSGKKALLVASSDLSHYYPYNIAESLDRIIIDDVARFDYEQLMVDLETERAEACGGGPIVAVLIAARRLGANDVRILHSCNSGDVTGDRTGVVGYLSAAVLEAD